MWRKDHELQHVDCYIIDDVEVSVVFDRKAGCGDAAPECVNGELVGS